MSTNERAVILLGQGGHNVPANRRLRQLAADLSSTGGTPVVAAFVQPGKDGAILSLGDAVEMLVSRGTGEFAIVPFLTEWAYPEHQDLPDLVRDLAETYPQIRLRLARPLGSAQGMLEVVVRYINGVWDLPPAGDMGVREFAAAADQTPITTARLGEDVFPALPVQEQHLLLCAGRRCLELGSADAYRAVTTLLAERGLDAGEHRVKVTRTKCLGPCAAAPMACLYPSGTYFARLGTEQMPAFVDEVLCGGGTLPEHAFRAGEE